MNCRVGIKREDDESEESGCERKREHEAQDLVDVAVTASAEEAETVFDVLLDPAQALGALARNVVDGRASGFAIAGRFVFLFGCGFHFDFFLNHRWTRMNTDGRKTPDGVGMAVFGKASSEVQRTIRSHSSFAFLKFRINPTRSFVIFK